MTSIKSYFNGRQILGAMHQKWWYFVINFIALFFAHPVFYLLKIGSMEINGTNYDGNLFYLEQIKRFAKEFFSVGEYIIPVLLVMVFASILSSVVMFSYLHNRKEINFLHSLPVRRESLFIANYLAGAAAFILPFLANVLIAIGCAAATGTIGYLSMGSYLIAVLQVILFYFVNYTIAVAAANLAGTVFAHICGILVLNFSVLFTYMVHYMFSEIFFATFWGESLNKVLIRISPYVRTFSILNEPLAWLEGTLYGIFCAVLIGVCIWIYKRRPSEKSGTPLIFDYSKPVLKYLIVLWGTAYMGMFFYAISGIGFMLFGFAAGGFLTHMACEVVFQKDFKAMLKNKLGLLTFLIAFGAVFSIYYYDITGFDTYIPDKTSVQSIDFTDGLEDKYYYNNRAKSSQPYTDDEEKALILQIAQLSINYKEQNQLAGQKGKNQTAEVSLSQKYSANMLQITVTYHLKSGRTVQRRYSSVPLVVMKEPFEALYNTRRYTENSSCLFKMDEINTFARIEIISAINQSETKYLERDKNNLTDEQGKKLMEAMKKDVSERTFADVQTYRQVFTITTSYEVLDEENEQKYFINAEVPVYENDVATLAVLIEDFGMKDPKETYQVLLDSIERIELYRYENLYDIEYNQKIKTGDYGKDIQPVVITDPAQIKELMASSILSGRYRNTLTLIDGSISASVIMKADASPEARPYYDYSNREGQIANRLNLQVKLDQLPNFAEALLNQ
jgi:ABC-2 type transport system permease protein